MTFIAFLIGMGFGVAWSIALASAFFAYNLYKAKKEQWRATPAPLPSYSNNVIAFPNTPVSTSQ
jgi:hypothetical protein